MGFRSNFITENLGGVQAPDWFTQKYPDYFYLEYEGKKVMAFAQVIESKFYRDFEEDERIKDIQKVLIEKDSKDIVMILLHECGGITRVQIFQDKIIAKEPTAWKQVTQVEHDYCYGCSD